MTSLHSSDRASTILSSKEREAYTSPLPQPTTASPSQPQYPPSAPSRTIKPLITTSASKNTSLLLTLSSTSTAPSELNRLTIDLESLRTSLTEQNARVKELTAASKRDYKTHKRYRDSVIVRFVHRALNKPQKFDERAMKEEKMYFASLDAQRKAESRRSELEASIKTAEKREKTLKTDAEKHGNAHAKLDELYAKIFTGPNPEFPTEDVKEEAFNRTTRSYEAQKERYKTATENGKSLNRAAVALRQARYQLQNTREDLEFSIFGVSDYHFDSLARSQEKMVEIEKLVDDMKVPVSEPGFQGRRVEVQRLLKGMQTLPSDIYTKHQLIQTISQRQQSLRTLTELLANLMTASKTAETHARDVFRRTARTLEDSRQALQQQRQAVFEEVAGFGEAPPSYGEASPSPGHADEAPKYHECCDRTEAFEQCEFRGVSGEEEAEGDLTADLESDRAYPAVEPEQERAEAHGPVRSEAAAEITPRRETQQQVAESSAGT